MGKKTGISWCDATWNPWTGCAPVSAGCDHCYMARQKRRFGQDPLRVVRSAQKTFDAPLIWHAWRGTPNGLPDGSRIFVCSWSDFFHPDADAWRSEAWDIMRTLPEYRFLILTKRIKRARECLPSDWGDGWPNIWVGTTAENQEMADKRLLYLLRIPAALRFISIEPMLGPLDFSKIILPDGDHFADLFNHGLGAGIDWVIVGGESGPAARAMHPAWVKSVRDQCRAAGVPFFFKQWGEWALKDYDNHQKTSDFGVLDPDGSWYHQHTGWNGRPIDPDTGEAYMVKVGRAAAGCLIDGEEIKQFPEEKS